MDNEVIEQPAEVTEQGAVVVVDTTEDLSGKLVETVIVNGEETDGSEEASAEAEVSADGDAAESAEAPAEEG